MITLTNAAGTVRLLTESQFLAERRPRRAVGRPGGAVRAGESRGVFTCRGCRREFTWKPALIAHEKRCAP